MKINYEGRVYDLDFEEITLKQLSVIKNFCHISLNGLQAGLAEGDADALRAFFWLMQVNSGFKVAIQDVDFKVLKFASAIQQASAEEAEADKLAAEAKAHAAVEDVPLPESKPEEPAEASAE